MQRPARLRSWILAGLVLAVLVAPLVPRRWWHPPDHVLLDVPASANGATPVFGYAVVRAFPHDRSAFTQGLVFEDGVLYESTGLHGQSSLRRVELETGRVLQKRALDVRYFAEGLAYVGARLVQLTWKEHVGFVHDARTFEPVGRFEYPNEGWGLTCDGKDLIQSDGTARLTFLDPVSFRPTRTLDVHDDKGPVLELNELEFVEGEILANVWQTQRIARIDPSTGRVLAWIDLSNLLPATQLDGADWLNGIAYDSQLRRLFVTGKLWPTLFEIRLVAPR